MLRRDIIHDRRTIDWEASRSAKRHCTGFGRRELPAATALFVGEPVMPRSSAEAVQHPDRREPRHHVHFVVTNYFAKQADELEQVLSGIGASALGVIPPEAVKDGGPG